MNLNRAFRPNPECLDTRVVPSDLPLSGLTPPQPTVQPIPLITVPNPDPSSNPVPLLTTPIIPSGPDTAVRTAPVSASVTVGGQTQYAVGTTTGVAVLIPTTGMPCGPGTIVLAFPDGTMGEFHGMINADDPAQGVQSVTDDDGVSYMVLPCCCTVPAIYPEDLGVSA